MRRTQTLEGVYEWPAAPMLSSPLGDDALPLEQLAADLAKMGLRPAVNRQGDLALTTSRDDSLGSEAYSLVITPVGIRLASSTAAGAYYGIQTLRDLLRVHGRQLPCCAIDDWPDFPRRGVYHDISRGKVPTRETLLQLVEWLAHWKINELQLYIENVFTFASHPAIGVGYDPLTPEDILQLQEHCLRHHVRLVGSLASFGHMEKILALPEYRHLAELPGTMGYPGGTTLTPVEPGSLQLVADLYGDFVGLLEAEDFNVCCDETWELGKGRSRPLAERRGLGQVYMDFVLELHRLCRRHGKRMNLWSDIVMSHPDLYPQLPDDAVLLNWEYDPYGERLDRTRELADAGAAFVVCPGTSAWQTHGSRLQHAIRNVSRFAEEGRDHGAQGLLNTDWGDYGHRNLLGVSLHGFAHGAAHAWHGRKVQDADFTDRFCAQVFHQPPGDLRLADALRLLGNAPLAAASDTAEEFERLRRMDGTHHARTLRPVGLYHGLVELLNLPRGCRNSAIDAAGAFGPMHLVELLSSRELWPAMPEGLDEFEDLAWEELLLAGTMDCVACRRIDAGRRMRSGERVAPGELLQLAEALEHVGDEFQSLWLARNRLSRLRYDLVQIHRAERESRRLARR